MVLFCVFLVGHLYIADGPRMANLDTATGFSISVNGDYLNVFEGAGTNLVVKLPEEVRGEPVFKIVKDCSDKAHQ